ncbi:3'-5' exonuclease family protein [Noviherbaspirillum humi]|uniref:3'-5' exonuclease family protein n=1 Tax=Noviherbaspirillum humi TaxID=1688639 RepID=UPI001FE4D9B3|nr:3'-5' exonuclease family protein [Noviherbaspirillum humi]
MSAVLSASLPFASRFPIAFVDLETTGGAATADRITEIGIIEVDADGVREWSSLVNPQAPIPEFIQQLTGISNEMVADAPTFAELADEISARLEGKIFIAHNARFDHGFLKNEFKRTGHAFRPAVLCTVRLSRKLFPGFARHSLDAIAERHRLQVTQRHRALGDAQLLWQFWQKIHEEHAPEAVEETVSKLISRPSLPSHLDAAQIEAIPSTHGVYLFYGANGMPLYIGKANNLRRRVLSHFSGDHLASKELEISQQTERIDWIPAVGELGALLQEARLVKQLMPSHNVLLRDNREICAWRLYPRNGQLKATLVGTDDMFFAHDPQLYGLFDNKRQAKAALKSFADQHALCHVVLGLEKLRDRSACFASQVKKCLGACDGREPSDAHNARVLEAMQPWQVQPWPYEGAVALRENGGLHVVDGWAYYGTVETLEEAAALVATGKRRFDVDVYRIVGKWLERNPGRVQLL